VTTHDGRRPPPLSRRGTWLQVDADEFETVITARGDVPDCGQVNYGWHNERCLVYDLYAGPLHDAVPGGDLPMAAELQTAGGSQFYRIQPSRAVIALMACE
jgi:hypothetical protein